MSKRTIPIKRVRRKRPVGAEAELYMGSAEALKMARDKGFKVQLATIHRWIDAHPHLGFQPGGRNCTYFIHIENFRRHLNG